MKKPAKKSRRNTNRQEAFIREYCKNGWNGTEAAIRAGYSKRPTSASVIASKLLRHAKIQERITYFKAHLEELLNISKSRVIAEHKKIAFSTIAHLHNTWIERKEFEKLTDEQKECIQEIDSKVEHRFKREYVEETQKMERVDYEVVFVKVRLYSKQDSLDSISKLMGYNEPDRLIIDDQRKTTAELFPPMEEMLQKAKRFEKEKE